MDRHLSVVGQCHREGGGRLLQWLLIRSWAGICRAATLDYPGQRRQPSQADQRPAPTASHWRGGEDPLCHGGQPTGRLDGHVLKFKCLFKHENIFDLSWLHIVSIFNSVNITGTSCSTPCSLHFSPLKSNLWGKLSGFRSQSLRFSSIPHIKATVHFRRTIWCSNRNCTHCCCLSFGEMEMLVGMSQWVTVGGSGSVFFFSFYHIMDTSWDVEHFVDEKEHLFELFHQIKYLTNQGTSSHWGTNMKI